jgi:hypothetical protein
MRLGNLKRDALFSGEVDVLFVAFVWCLAHGGYETDWKNLYFDALES